MEIVYHIGLHCTDEGMAMRCLMRNARALAEIGTAIVQPAKFRPVLREAMISLRGAPADADLQKTMLTSVLDEAEAQRVVFSNDNFLCTAARAAEGAVLYDVADERMPWIRNLFPDCPTIFAFALRNPVTLLPALHARFSKGEPLEEYLARVEPDALSWAETVMRMREAVPDAQFLVWCNEDTPLIWPEVLEGISGAPDPMSLKGVHDLVATIMTEPGLQRMAAYLESHPPRDAEHRRRVTAAFLDKFARPEAVEVELEGPGWTAERVAAITARYEADVARIRATEGVRFLAA